MTKKLKTILIGAAGLCLVAAVTFNSTLAYMTDKTTVKTNSMTVVEEGIEAVLIEPKWDGVVGYEIDMNGNSVPVYEYRNGAAVYGYTNGNYSLPVTKVSNISSSTTKPTFDSADATRKWQYGEDAAKTMIPGCWIDKDPTIVNTSDKVDIWVAVKATLVYGESSDKAGQEMSVGDAQTIWDIISIETNSAWTPVDENSVSNSREYYYNALLACGQESIPVFDGVSVRSDATNDQIKNLQSLGGFSLMIKGFAAQKEVAKTADGFLSWGTAGGVVFE